MAMSDRQLVADPHAAVELDHLVAEGQRGVGDEHAGAVDRLGETWLAVGHNREVEQGAGLLDRGILRRHAVLDRLETAEWSTELLAGAQVVERFGEHPPHDPERLRRPRQRGGGFDRHDVVPAANERFCGHIVEGQRKGDRAIGHAPRTGGQAGVIRGHEIEARRRAFRRAGRDEKSIDPATARHARLDPAQPDPTAVRPRTSRRAVAPPAGSSFMMGKRDAAAAFDKRGQPIVAKLTTCGAGEQATANQQIIDQRLDQQSATEGLEQ